MLKNINLFTIILFNIKLRISKRIKNSKTNNNYYIFFFLILLNKKKNNKQNLSILFIFFIFLILRDSYNSIKNYTTTYYRCHQFASKAHQYHPNY